MKSFFVGGCLVLSLPIFSVSAFATTLSVPAEYATVAAAITAAEDGDTIEIEAGEYTSSISATFSQDNLTIKGVGGKAHLNADGLTLSNGKGIFVINGDNVTLDNIEFSHATVSDENGAGIRHQGGLLTLNNCYFHDNENGIMTAGQSNGELVVNYSEFKHNGLGSAGYTHNIYVGNIARFVFNGSYSHLTTSGHNIKSRAQKNYILYSRIMDEESGNASYQIDLPNGGLSYIIGNIIQQGTKAENSVMIAYAEEGAKNSLQQVQIINNTLVNDKSSSIGIWLRNSPYAVIENNIFDNVSVAVKGTASVFQNNLETTESGFVDRDAYDYHLLETSAARDAGIAPGSYSGMSLTPESQYVEDLQLEERPTDAALDIGAYEYGTSSSNLLLMVLPALQAAK